MYVKLNILLINLFIIARKIPRLVYVIYECSSRHFFLNDKIFYFLLTLGNSRSNEINDCAHITSACFKE